MIIVSQDRKFISENLEIGVIPIYENGKDVIVGYKVENDYLELGIYKSEERAKEVLQEIQNVIIGNKLIEISSNLGDMTKANRMGYELTPVYEMPLE